MYSISSQPNALHGCETYTCLSLRNCNIPRTSNQASPIRVAKWEIFIVIPIKNRWSIIFDWSFGKQSIFFITEFRSFSFGMIKWSIFFQFFPVFFFFFFFDFFFTNEYAKRQHATLEKPKEKFHFCFSFYLLSLLQTVSLDRFFETDWSTFLHQLIDFFRPTDRSINFLIFFNWSIKFLKWLIID